MAAELASILNFRDVAATINNRTGKPMLNEGLLFRSARPDEASKEDRERLRNVYGIKTIIDLRSKTEHIQNAEKRDAKIKGSELAGQSNDRTAEPLKIPGMKYAEINFNGSAYVRSLMSQLSWWDSARLVGLMATGYRVDAIKIIGEKVMNVGGLVDLAIRSVDVCTKEVLEVFKVLSDPMNYPVMVHCTQGKDRTGLIVQLVLLMLGIEEDAINHDYMLTGPALQSEREERLKEIRSIGLDDKFADCDPELVHAVTSHIHEKFKTVKGGYLDRCGVTEEMQALVTMILLQKPK